MRKTIHQHLLFTIVIGLVMTLILATARISTVLAVGKTITYPYYGFVEDPENPWESVYDALDETGTVEYDDEFFFEPSPGDHPELRVLSYALALAGYENQASGYPSDTSEANPKLLGMLREMGFSDFEIWDATSEENGNSFGTTIGHKTLSNGQELVVIAPRNYNYLTEWLSNINVGTEGDHVGFSDSAALVTERLNQYLTGRNLSNYKLWAVGYSRGGAVIDLFAKHFNENIANYQIAPEDFYAYTFGAPRASVTAPNYTNIHDVKDGNDLLLGYVFPEVWGFHNTGTLEEIHPADLEVTQSVVYIADLVDSSKAPDALVSGEELDRQVGTMNGKVFMDDWFNFVTESGLTRDYFNTEVKPPLAELLKVYQKRTLDKQSELLDFIKDTTNGLAGMVVANALSEILNSGYTSFKDALDNSPLYQDLVKALKGTATDTEMDELVNILTSYMGEYSDYEEKIGQAPAVTEAEFATIKENLPKLARALLPIVVLDARYTQSTYGEDYSLYHTYSLISNAEKLAVGHIPESMMPLLKDLIVPVPDAGEDEVVVPKAPNTGYFTEEN